MKVVIVSMLIIIKGGLPLRRQRSGPGAPATPLGQWVGTWRPSQLQSWYQQTAYDQSRRELAESALRHHCSPDGESKKREIPVPKYLKDDKQYYNFGLNHVLRVLHLNSVIYTQKWYSVDQL